MSILADVRDAWRTMRRRPGFALAAVAMLTVGLGVNVAGFAILYGLPYRPLPFPSPDRIVVAHESGETPFSPATFRDVRPLAHGIFATR